MSRLAKSWLLSLAFLIPALLTAGTDPKYHWQDGEIISRKTIPAGGSGIQYEYVYRLRGSGTHYVVIAKEPLKVGLRTPVKYAPLRRHIVIQDSDGRECKVRIRERSKTGFQAWR
jgi:hypothetical protein